MSNPTKELYRSASSKKMAQETTAANQIDVQKETFTNWSNNVLKDCNIEIKNLESDLRNGLVVIHFYQQLTGNRINRFNSKPRMRIAECENLGIALKAFHSDGLRLVNISPEDINDGNLKIILGFIWCLIIRYQILRRSSSESEGSPKKLLLDQVNKQLENYPPHIKNFLGDWADGSALSDLVDSFSPGTLPESERSDDPLERIDQAMKIAEEKYSVPRVLEAEHMANAVDELSGMTYISYFKDISEKSANTPNASSTIAHGTGLENSDSEQTPHKFEVEIRNQFGNRLKQKLENPDLLEVKILDPFKNNIPAKIHTEAEETNEGVYPVEYDAQQPGKYYIEVTLDGKHIKDSPFDIELSHYAHDIDPKESYASGLGLKNARATKPAKFTLHAIDHDGNHVPSDSMPFVVKIEPEDIDVKHTNNGDGTYDIIYTPNEAGPIDISALLNNEHIHKSPQHIDAKEAPADDLKVECSGDALKGLYDNTPNKLNVCVTDPDGNPVDNCNVDVQLKDADGNKVGKVIVDDNGDGNYPAEIGCEDHGDYEIIVGLDGEEKEKFPVNCSAGVQPELVEGSFTFEVVAKDKNGESMTTGGADWQVFIKGPNDAEIDVETFDHNDGRYSAKYYLAAAEDGNTTFKVHAKLDGEHVASSPFKHELSPKPSLAARFKNFFKRKE